MKVYDFECVKCGEIKLDVIVTDETPKCCDQGMNRLPVATKEYHIRGVNTASTKPDKSKSTA